MKEDVSVFRRFPTLDQATEFNDWLTNAGIATTLADNLPPFDVTFSGNTLNHQFEIKMKPSDFKRAEAIIEQKIQQSVDRVQEDYYLFDYSNGALYDILMKSDEWSTFDYLLAQKILKQRGESVDTHFIDSLKKDRIHQLSKPEASQKPWIIVGYLCAVLGGFLGLVIGYFLWTSKKTLPGGQKIHTYSNTDRNHGKYIFYLGLVVTPALIFFKMTNRFWF